MLWASFASVFPVQGAMIRASRSLLGPMGSTSAMDSSGCLPQISAARAEKAAGWTLFDLNERGYNAVKVMAKGK